MRDRRPEKTGGVFAAWNTLRIFSGRERRRWLRVVRRSRTVNVGQDPRGANSFLVSCSLNNLSRLVLAHYGF